MYLYYTKDCYLLFCFGQKIKNKKSNPPPKAFINIRGMFLQQLTWKDACFSVLMQFEFLTEVYSKWLLKYPWHHIEQGPWWPVPWWSRCSLRGPCLLSFRRHETKSQLCLTQVWPIRKFWTSPMLFKVTIYLCVSKKKILYSSIYLFLAPFGILIANHCGTFGMISDWEPTGFCSVRNFSDEIRLWCHTSVRHRTPKNLTDVFFHASWPLLCWPKFKPYYNVLLGDPFVMSINKQTSLIQRVYPVRPMVVCVHVHRKCGCFPFKKSHVSHVYLCISCAKKDIVYTYIPCACMNLHS